MPFAAGKGVRIHFDTEGAGPLLVLLHGFGVSGDAWRAGGHDAVTRAG